MNLLSGLRVIDLTSTLAGPYATMLMGDFGAEVVKVEPPGGDPSRKWGDVRDGGMSMLFVALNRNKRSVVIDLKDSDGRSRVHRLIESADIVVESFAPASAARLGVDFATTTKLRPGIIHVSVSGFGQDGPLRDRPGLDMMLQAHTGMMSFLGEPGRPPIRMAVSAIDLMAGTLAFAGTMAALQRRESKESQWVDVSLYDSAVNMLTWAIPQTVVSGQNPRPFGGEFEHLFPYGNYQTADGYLYVGVSTGAHWQRFCAALDLLNLAEDPRFSSNEARLKNREELHALLAPVLLTWESAALEDRLLRSGVPASKVRTVSEAVDDEHARSRGSVREVPGHPGVLVAGNPIRITGTPAVEWAPPPQLDEHSDQY